jgi:hypothetical protein
MHCTLLSNCISSWIERRPPPRAAGQRHTVSSHTPNSMHSAFPILIETLSTFYQFPAIIHYLSGHLSDRARRAAPGSRSTPHISVAIEPRAPLSILRMPLLLQLMSHSRPMAHARRKATPPARTCASSHAQDFTPPTPPGSSRVITLLRPQLRVRVRVVRLRVCRHTRSLLLYQISCISSLYKSTLPYQISLYIG